MGRLPDPEHARPLWWAVVTFLALIVAGQVAHGQTFACVTTPEDPLSGAADEYCMARESDDVAVIRYHNHVRSVTRGGIVVVNADGLFATTRTTVGVDGGHEGFEVEAPPGWVADPPHVTVPEGETAFVILYRGNAPGM